LPFDLDELLHALGLVPPFSSVKHVLQHLDSDLVELVEIVEGEQVDPINRSTQYYADFLLQRKEPSLSAED
jgi:hypothetical protein